MGAYYTGSAVNAAALKTVVETHCITNGWTLSGSDYLYKGQSNVNITAPTDYKLLIAGANSPDGLIEPVTKIRGFFVKPAEWPVNYHLFIWDTPDIVVLVIHHYGTLIKVMMFGEIVKVDNAAFVGGNFAWATSNDVADIINPFNPDYNGYEQQVFFNNINDLKSGSGDFFTNVPSCIPFAIHSVGGGSSAYTDNAFHAKVDGNIWDVTNKITYTDQTLVQYYRSPNTWNTQTHLIPLSIQFTMQSNLYNYLGYLEHIRLVRIDNYEIGDIIEITPDRWKVFPWLQKNLANRNGNGVSNASGTLGFAVRYTDP